MMISKKKKEKMECKYEWRNYKCSRDALPGDEYCIFHSKDIEGKKEKFNDEFWKEFERQKEYEDIYDFTGFLFPGDISFEGKIFEKDVNFCTAQFYGEAYFVGVKFSVNAYFMGTLFYKITFFNNAEFTEKSDFTNAEFTEKASFWKAIFTGETNCFQTKLSDAIFLETQFYGKANFREAQFSGEAFFKKVKFFENVEFSIARFNGGANFLLAEFTGSANFWKARFFSEAGFFGVHFTGLANFNEAQFYSNAEFSSVTFKDINFIEMKKTFFNNVSGLFEIIEDNVKVVKKLRKRSKTLKTEFLPKNFYLILGEESTAKYPVQSRQIRDDVYLLDRKERISKMHGIKRGWHGAFFFLWWLTANYGRRFWQWALCCVIIAFIFGAVFSNSGAPDWLPFKDFFYSINPEFQISPESRIPTWFTPYYFSIVTFTTLGFGDVTPLNLEGEIWLAIEVILGYIMLGGLISILANKLARRS